MQALRIDLRPSLRLAGALILAHGLALAAAWISLSGWMRYVAGAGVLASAAVCLAQALLRTDRQTQSLELHEDGRASWRNRDGRWYEGRLGRNSFVSAALVVLELEIGSSGRKRVVLMGDSASQDDFRRLRVWLRWRRGGGQPEPE